MADQTRVLLKLEIVQHHDELSPEYEIVMTRSPDMLRAAALLQATAKSLTDMALMHPSTGQTLAWITWKDDPE